MITFEPLAITVKSEDSALGRWTVGRWSPSNASPLSRSVEHIWYFDGRLMHPRERVFPDGTAELIVMLDDVHRDGDLASLPPFPAVCLNGLRMRPSVVVAPHGRCRVLGITLTPLGAAALLRSSMTELVDVTIDLREALGGAADELGERCSYASESSQWNAARNARAVIQSASRWAEQNIGDIDGADHVIDFATRTIRAARGGVGIAAMRTALGVSHARFVRRFRDRSGVTPKQFARIVRFDTALSRLVETQNIARVASELGYYDQAHMHRDFAEFAHMTPGAFLAANRYPGSASLAEP